MTLTEDYATNGFVVLPGLLRADECAALRDEAAAIVSGERWPAIAGLDRLPNDTPWEEPESTQRSAFKLTSRSTSCRLMSG